MSRIEEGTENKDQPSNPEPLSKRKTPVFFEEGVYFATLTQDEAIAFEKLKKTDFWKILVEAERRSREAYEKRGVPNWNPSRKGIVDTSRLPNENETTEEFKDF